MDYEYCNGTSKSLNIIKVKSGEKTTNFLKLRLEKFGLKFSSNSGQQYELANL